MAGQKVTREFADGDEIVEIGRTVTYWVNELDVMGGYYYLTRVNNLEIVRVTKDFAERNYVKVRDSQEPMD